MKSFLSQRLQCHTAEDGRLFPLDLDDLPFKAVRFFMVTDVPAGERRGMHAHFVNKTFLFCAQGEIEVTLHDGVIEESNVLRTGDGIFIDNMIWDSQVYKTGKDILLAFCSLPYTPSDYIHDFDIFTKLAVGD